MADPYTGEIRMFAGNYAPVDWAKCDGQRLQISQYESLYAVIGLNYGGDNVSFCLPDMRGRSPLGTGMGPGLLQYVIGQSGGVSNVTLNQNNLPPHTHSMTADDEDASSKHPYEGGLSLAARPNQTVGPRKISKSLYCAPSANQQVAMSAASISSSGGNSAHPNRQPCMAISFIICMNGIFPSRT